MTEPEVKVLMLKGDKGDGLSDDDMKKVSALISSNVASAKASINDSLNVRLANARYVPEIFANSTDLKTKYPTGKDGIFITADTGHMWLFVNGNWVDAGTYQATTNLEVEDARVWASSFGEEKSATLGDAIRGQFNYLTNSLYLTAKANKTPLALASDYVTGSRTAGHIESIENNNLCTTNYTFYGEAGDVIEVSGFEGGDKKCGVVSQKNGNIEAGNYGDKTFYFVLPANDVYAINFWASDYNTRQLEPYEIKNVTIKRYKSPLNADYTYIVDINGDGDFTKISDAVKNMKSGDSAYIRPGLYQDEEIEAFNKNITLVGESKERVIITNNSGDYSSPALEMNIGVLKNVTIYQDKDLTTKGANTPYAMHVEGGPDNATLKVINCDFYARYSAAVGIGTRPGCNYVFENCSFYTDHDTNGVGVHVGAAFIHPSNGGTSTDQVATFKNCTMNSKHGSALHVQYWQPGNVLSLAVQNCMLWSDETELADTISTQGDAVGTVVISKKSFGNNVEAKL